MLYRKYVKSNNTTNVVSRRFVCSKCSIDNALICPGGFPPRRYSQQQLEKFTKISH